MSKYREFDRKVLAILRIKPQTFRELHANNVLVAMGESLLPPSNSGTGQAWRVLSRRLELMQKVGLTHKHEGYWTVPKVNSKPVETKGWVTGNEKVVNTYD